MHPVEIPTGGVAQASLRAVDRRRLVGEEFWRPLLQRREPDSAVATATTTGDSGHDLDGVNASDDPTAAVTTEPAPVVRASNEDSPPLATASPHPRWRRRRDQRGWTGRWRNGSTWRPPLPAIARNWLAEVDPDTVTELLADR
jgi:hypothetical protein